MLNEIEVQRGEDGSEILQRGVCLAMQGETAPFDGEARGRRDSDVDGTARACPDLVGDTTRRHGRDLGPRSMRKPVAAGNKTAAGASFRRAYSPPKQTKQSCCS